jgi:hypothetical protein
MNAKGGFLDNKSCSGFHELGADSPKIFLCIPRSFSVAIFCFSYVIGWQMLGKQGASANGKRSGEAGFG